MGWTGYQDPALEAYVAERQERALLTYENDPDLLEEHVRQEDSFRVGGYGTRQVSELLQNAVDALGGAEAAGRIELRMADGALYCANTGSPFTQEGIRAVSYAFLSPKKEDEIGRFGLGFKSVLGITANPQIYSQTVSFEFGSPDVRELFSGLPAAGGRLPLLRVPMLVDPMQAAKHDPNLRDLMTWATTIVKLPLQRDAQRIHEELAEFDPESLLFLTAVGEFVVSTVNKDGALMPRVFRREVVDGGMTVILRLPDGTSTWWLYAEREYQPSERVLESLPDTQRRRRMTVSYAVDPSKRQRTGRLWAWFPLQDETTAGGFFNAPWQINDDRTSLVAASALNGEMLKVAADLFLDVVVRASNHADPAAHLDLFPARGAEARSLADRFLSMVIPEQASQREMVPDKRGELFRPASLNRVVDVDSGVNRTESALWNSLVPWNDVPHETCYATPQRRARLRSLLGKVTGKQSGKRTDRELTLSAWLEELGNIGTQETIDGALKVSDSLRRARDMDRRSVDWTGLLASRIVPIMGGGHAALGDTGDVLIPREGAAKPDGIRLIDISELTEGSVARLRSFGFRDVSVDEVVRTLGSSLRKSSNEVDWLRFWETSRNASSQSVREALTAMRDRELTPLVKTRAGVWRLATEVLLDDGFATNLPARHADRQLHPDVSALRASGCLDEPVETQASEEMGLFDLYVDAMQLLAAETMGVEVRHVNRAALERRLAPQVGVGPASLLAEGLEERDRLVWTERLARSMRTSSLKVTVVGSFMGASASMDLPTLERWAIMDRGCVLSSQGVCRPGDAVGYALRSYGWTLPVASSDVSLALDLARKIPDVPDVLLLEFLNRDDYVAPDPESLVELLAECAHRASIPVPTRVPAIQEGQVRLCDPRGVVVTSDTEEMAEAAEAKLAWLPDSAGADELLQSWGIERAGAVLSRWIESNGVAEGVPLIDLHPSLSSYTTQSLAIWRVAKADAIRQLLKSPAGEKARRLSHALGEGNVVLVDHELDELGVLSAVNAEVRLGLTAEELRRVLEDDDLLRRSEVVARARAAASDEERLLCLVSVGELKAVLPRGLLAAVESERGKLDDLELASLVLRTHGYDSVQKLRANLQAAGIAVPTKWDGSQLAQKLVKDLGFSTSFAGARSVNPPNVTQVQGKIVLKGLHDFQAELAVQIRDLVYGSGHRRGLLYLPTGAGKTRVSVEAILSMMKEGVLSSPVLWIAQTQELCEQAIQSFAEVWRWLGDERPLDVSRFWTGHELDESTEELQIVVAIDDTLANRLGEPEYEWLADAGMVVIDEAHTAGNSPTYTAILRALGVTASSTARPLLGLTATPFKGRNPEVNRLFAQRFGDNRLEALDSEDPIGELRRRGVLAEVDHAVLSGSLVTGSGTQLATRLREVSRSMLDEIGDDLARTQTVVGDISEKVDAATESFPVLVFAASVASAHTIAALLELRGIRASAVDGSMRPHERRRIIQQFKDGDIQVLVNCDLLTQGFDAPKVRALYIARPTFSPNRYLQMVGRGLRGPANGGTERCLIVNVEDTFEQFGDNLAYTEFDYLWSKG